MGYIFRLTAYNLTALLRVRFMIMFKLNTIIVIQGCFATLATKIFVVKSYHFCIVWLKLLLPDSGVECNQLQIYLL